MNYFKFFILSCLILFPFTSTSYGLTNSWCSNGKYSKDISPFPKPSFGKCPKTAKKIMSKKEVEEYYINGLGQEHLCTLIKSGYLYKLKDRKDYKAIIELIKGKDTKCDQFLKTKLAEKKVEKIKQKTLFTGSTISFASSKLMSENFEDKNDLKVSDYDRNWTIEKLDNGNSVYCNQIKNRWTGFNFGEKNWHNYSISYRIKFVTGKVGELHTHIRKNRNRQGEYRSHHKKSGNIDLVYVKGADRIRDRIVNGSKASIGDNWANIKIIASGNNIAYFVNGKIVANTKDDRLKKGAAMIAVSENSKSCVDDIVVINLEQDAYQQELKEIIAKQKTLAQKKEDEDTKIRASTERLPQEEIAKQLKQKEEQKRRKAEELAKQKALAKMKAEEEGRIRALAEKLAKEEIARQLKIKQKEEEEAKQEAIAQKKAKEDAARKKALAKKKAKKLAKQKAIAAKKAKEDKARKKALAKEKAEELAKQKAIAAKKAEEEGLKLKVRNEKIQKLKDEAKYVVATLKEYVKTDANKLDILEVSELLENYNSSMQKGWSDSTVEKYEELYDYVQKDEGFIEFSADKKSKQLAAYNEEIIQLREYLTTSQTKLKAFITKNLGSNNAKKALKLAKETKSLLKDFDVNQAMALKNNISTWKAMNGVAEDKKYIFKILNKKIAEKKQSVIKKDTQDKLVNNTKKKKKTNPQTNTDSSFTNVIFENKWQFSRSVKCSSGSYTIYDKKNGNIFVLGGEKQISPNPTEVKIFQIDNKKIRIETKIFSNNTFKKMNGGKSFPVFTSTEVVTVLQGNKISTKKTLKRIDTSRFMNNPSDKIYKTTQEGGSSVSCGLLSGAKKGNQSSQANTLQQNQKKNKAKKLKSNLSKPNLKDSIFRKADNLKVLAGKCYLSVPSVSTSTITSLYLNANRMYNNGVKFLKLKQTDTATNMLKSANMQYENMIRVGRQVGGRSC